METIICRTGYCPLCERSQNPKSGQQFLSFGAKYGYHVDVAQHNGKIGMTPHIYKGKVFHDNVIVEIACAMYECGVSRVLEEENGQKFWFYYVTDFRREIWTTERWNALVLFKDHSYYV